MGCWNHTGGDQFPTFASCWRTELPKDAESNLHVGRTPQEYHRGWGSGDPGSRSYVATTLGSDPTKGEEGEGSAATMGLQRGKAGRRVGAKARVRCKTLDPCRSRPYAEIMSKLCWIFLELMLLFYRMYVGPAGMARRGRARSAFSMAPRPPDLCFVLV